MATSTIPNPNAVSEGLTVELANTNYISQIAGTPIGYRCGNKMICYISLGFKTTSQRDADMAVFRLKINGKIILPVTPYFVPCMVNSDNVIRWSYKSGDTSGYFQNPVIWNANAEFRISGVFIGDIQS